MAKSKRSRNKNIAPSSGHSSKFENPKAVDECSHESCERQVDFLNKEIVILQCSIDAFKIDLISYLLNCVQRKDAEIEFQKEHFENLLSWIFLQNAAHEDRVAKILIETDMSKERLSSEKAILSMHSSKMN
ncbi:hypothetical protein AHF37_06358 [Paragonimus kellicotti]|nr:hypothetical protein AHF37_06358 [Paragonimus kellicotti]